MSSPLGKARGLGSAKHGVGHWWAQRMTALALVPVTLWFFSSLFRVAGSPDPFRVADWLASPWQALLAALLVVLMFWHAKLGLQVVIEDYVHAPFAKYTLLIANSFFCYGFIAAGLMAVLKLHLLDIVSGF